MKKLKKTKKVEVMLLEKLLKLGDIGSIQMVSKGFFRNYLLGKGQAVLATPENRKDFELKRSVIEKQNEIKVSNARELASKIESIQLKIDRKSAEDGRLYGSVTALDISKALSGIVNSNIASTQVDCTSRIRSIGSYAIKVILHPDVVTSINLDVTRTGN